jgi:formiminoglutamase
MTAPFEVIAGTSPVILGQPHVGTAISEAVAGRLNETGRAIADTDWHIDRLYDGLLPAATLVRARYSRYVIDLNRDPSGASLYPGANTTGLCPVTDFDGRPIYAAGQEPSPEETEERRQAYHTPYHEALTAEIARIKARHGLAVLYDCHSIRSEIPFLFEGTLPVFNVGTGGGASAAGAIEAVAAEVCRVAETESGYDWVLNGRFKGGWTTRHYGRPQDGVHAIQMELAQRAYMDEAPPWTYREDRAAGLRRHLEALLTRIERLALDGGIR